MGVVLFQLSKMADQDLKDILDIDKDPQTPHISKEAILGTNKVKSSFNINFTGLNRIQRK